MTLEKINSTTKYAVILFGIMIFAIPLFYLLVVGIMWFVYLFKVNSFNRFRAQDFRMKRLMYALTVDSILYSTFQLWVLMSSSSYLYMILASVVYVSITLFIHFRFVLPKMIKVD
jgi:hypothetical protein